MAENQSNSTKSGATDGYEWEQWGSVYNYSCEESDWIYVGTSEGNSRASMTRLPCFANIPTVETSANGFGKYVSVGSSLFWNGKGTELYEAAQKAGGTLYARHGDDVVYRYEFSDRSYVPNSSDYTWKETEYRKRLINNRYPVKGDNLLGPVTSFVSSAYPDDRVPRRLLVRSH